jgi:hypothetical protein
MQSTKHLRIFCLALLAAAFCLTRLSMASEDAPKLPAFYLDGQPAAVTVQDLSGLATRPLRLLIARNNKARGEEWIQAYALGARGGEDLRVNFAAPIPGMRVTLYKIVREEKGPNTLSMPSTVYFAEAGENSYQEKIEPFKEIFFIVVFEKTDSSDEKDVNVRYFEERVRDLVIGSYKTNWRLSSLKLRMRDFANDQAREFYDRDAQVLIDRLIDPRRIFLVRVWKADKA